MDNWIIIFGVVVFAFTYLGFVYMYFKDKDE
jgi:hypothetical protein